MRRLRFNTGARRPSHLVALVLAVGLVGTAVACGEPAPPPPPPRQNVMVVYGDSLIVQVEPLLTQRLQQLLPSWRIVVRAGGGLAQCDLHGSMRTDAAELNVKGVVIAFSGNDFTPCITSRPMVQGYVQDFMWAHDFWNNHVVAHTFVAATSMVGSALANRSVGNAYADLSHWFGVPLAETAPFFTQGSPATFRRDMPCLIGEVKVDGRTPCSDYATVRDDEGGHLCNDPVCTVYEPGATRFVEPIVQAVATMLGVGAPPPLLMRDLPPAPVTTTTSTSTTTSTTSTTTTTVSPSTTTVAPTTTTTAP